MDRHDAIVVGGSFAGLSAAVMLARARRRLLLIDAGQPRNRFAAASHGFLGQDGVAPPEIMRAGLTQLACYPAVDFVHAEALTASLDEEGATLTLSDGAAVRARKLILATGVAMTCRLNRCVRAGASASCTAPTATAMKCGTEGWP